MNAAERQIVRRVLLGYTHPEKSLFSVWADSIRAFFAGDKASSDSLKLESGSSAREPNLRNMSLSEVFRLSYYITTYANYFNFIAAIYEEKVKKPADKEIVEAIFNCFFHCDLPKLIPKISQ